MKTILLILLVTCSWSLNFSGWNEALVSKTLNTPVQSTKFFLYPNPATTELNIEFVDDSFTDGLIVINDASGRKYAMIPVRGKKNLSIPFDRRFVPGDYDLSIIRGKSLVSKSFTVVE